MRRSLVTLGIALACTGAAVSSAPARDNRQSDAARFAELTRGLVADKPQACMNERLPSTGLTAVGSRLVYKVSRGLVYVNDTTGGCERVARDDILVTKSYSGRLCQGDIARTISRTAPQFDTGGCALGPFTRYHRP